MHKRQSNGAAHHIKKILEMRSRAGDDDRSAGPHKRSGNALPVLPKKLSQPLSFGASVPGPSNFGGPTAPLWLVDVGSREPG